jgi:hypothetical protein
MKTSLPFAAMAVMAIAACNKIAPAAGYYTRSEGEETPRHFACFHMTVERSPDGVPRIASETPSFPIPPPAAK